MVSPRATCWVAVQYICLLSFLPKGNCLNPRSSSDSSLSDSKRLVPLTLQVLGTTYSVASTSLTNAATTSLSVPSRTALSPDRLYTPLYIPTENPTRIHSAAASDGTSNPSTTPFLPGQIVTLPAQAEQTSYVGPPVCTTVKDGDQITIWQVVSNPLTVTITLGLSSTVPLITVPEFSPPTYCISTSLGAAAATSLFAPPATSSGGDDLRSTVDPPARSTRPTPITIIITSKNPVTVYTTATPPLYPAGNGQKHSLQPPSETGLGLDWGSAGDIIPKLPPPSVGEGAEGQRNAKDSGVVSANGPRPDNPSGQIDGETGNRGGSNAGSESFAGKAGDLTEVFVVAGVTVILAPAQVVIGRQTIKPMAIPTQVIENGETFTLSSSQVLVLGATFKIPPLGLAQLTSKSNTGLSGVLTLATVENPSIQVITAGGITFSKIGPSLVFIGDSTFTVRPDVKPTTQIFNGKTISIGPGGIGFSSTTVPAAQPTAKNGACRLMLAQGILKRGSTILSLAILGAFL